MGGSDGSVSGSYNLIGTGGSGGLINGVNNNQVGVANPLLGTLGNYGGPTQTIPLLPGSPAIGKGGSVTALSAGVDSAATSTSITVANGLVFAASSLPTLTSGSYFLIQVDSEQMAVVGLTLNADNSATLDVVRGANGTQAASHPASEPVFLASDQRGFIRGSTVAADIGAFQDQGFVLTASPPTSPGMPLATVAGTKFASPLVVTVTAKNTPQFTNPVNGGVITFTVNPVNGASATLSATTAVISGGEAGPISATANTTVGAYTVTASAAGVAQPATFYLDNQYLVVPQFDQTKAHNSGSTIPITIQVTNQGQNVGSASLLVTAVSVVDPNGNVLQPPPSPGNSQPGGLFTFDPTTKTYQFNLKTTGFASGKYTFNFTVGNDPTPYSVNFVIG